MRLFLLAVTLLVESGIAAAETIALPPDRFYAVLASRQDPDEAIGLARAHPDVQPTVLHALNGWYAVVSGPYEVKAMTGRAFLDGLIRDHNLPKDAYLARSTGFDGVTWRAPAIQTGSTIGYDEEHDLTVARGDLTLTLSRKPDGDGTFDPTLRATYKGGKAFSIVIDDNASQVPASSVEIVRLDPSSPLPQIVFTYFWQGAHCCAVTRIASLASDGSWRVIDGDNLDGDGGYAFEDVSGDGFSHLVSSDNAFLYAFAPYAGSYTNGHAV